MSGAGTTTSAAASGDPLKADALDALLAAVDPGLAAFIRDQREVMRPDLERDDSVGIQARMLPVVEAFMACYTHETRRAASRGTDAFTQVAGLVAVVANLADQIAINIAENIDVAHADAVSTIVAMIAATLNGRRRSTGRYEGAVAMGAA